MQINEIYKIQGRIQEIEEKIKLLKHEKEVVECEVKSEYASFYEHHNKHCAICKREWINPEQHHLLCNQIGHYSNIRESYTILICRDCHVLLHIKNRDEGLNYGSTEMNKEKERYIEMIYELYDLKLLLKIIQFLDNGNGFKDWIVYKKNNDPNGWK